MTLISDTINADLVNAGVLTIQGLNAINGSFDNQALATLRLEGVDGIGLTTLTIADGSTFASLGAIELTNTSTVARPVTLTVTAGTLVNQDTISVLAGTTGGTRTINAGLDNQGTLQLVDSDLTVNTGVAVFTSDAGTLSIASGQTLTVSGTTVLGTGTTFVGTGTLFLNGPNLDLSSDLTLAAGSVALDLGGGSAVTVNAIDAGGAARLIN